MNEQNLSRLGLPNDEVIGKTYADFHSEEESEDFRKIVNKVLRTGKSLSHEHLSLRDGRYFLRTYSPIIKPDGKAEAVTVISKDISDIKNAEEKTRKSEKRYRELVEKAGIAILIDNRAGNIVYSNEKLAEIFGYAHEEMKGQTIRSIVHPDDVDRVMENHERRMMGKKLPSRYEFKGIKKDGSTIYSEVSAVELEKDNKIIGSRSYIWDITEKKRAKRLIEESRQEIQLISDNVPGLISYVGADGYYRFVNKQYEKWFGIPREKIIGHHYRQVLGEATYKKIKTYVKKALSGQNVSYIDSLPYKQRGVRWVNASYVPDIDDRGNVSGFYALVTDITERRKIEEERDKLIHDMGERIKEFNCLYHTSRFIQKNRSLPDIFQDLVDIIPSSWQYPEITRTKVRFNRDEYISGSFKETKWKQTSDIVVHGKRVGSIEVYYLEEKPELDEGPFLKEERELIDTLARQLAEAIERIEAEKSLQKIQELYAGLADSITDVFFAVDHDLKYTYWNKASEKLTGIAAKDALGKSILDISPDDENTRKAIEFYKKVLTTKQSKTFANKYQLGGKDFFFEISAYPSREGLSVFVKDITEHVQAEEAVKRHKNELQRLSSQLINAQEDERRRISHELHDEIGQSLTMMKLNLASIKDTLGPEQFSCIKKKWEDLNILTERLLEEAHQMTLDLRPHILDDLGLLSTLRWYVGSLSKKLDVDIKLKAANLEERLVPELEITLYRIVQEALTNIARHAQAKNVLLNIKRLKSSIKLKIEDDGKGFVLDEVDKPTQKEHGVGLFGMKERASLLNGKCIIESKPGEGTRVSVTLPLG
jgi:PAS domain S-box-containing protein